MKCLDHINCRNPFGNADDQLHTCVGGFHDRVGSEWWRNVNDSGIRASFFDGVGHSIEDRKVFVCRAAFAGRHAANDVGAVIAHLQCVESSFFASKTLNNKTSIFINQNAQSSSSDFEPQIKADERK